MAPRAISPDPRITSCLRVREKFLILEINDGGVDVFFLRAMNYNERTKITILYIP